MDNPAAWHPDPSGKHDHRWWDGQRWTEHVADAGVASVDPLPPAPDAAGAATDRPDDAAAPATDRPADAGTEDAGTTAAAGATDTGAGLADDVGETRRLDPTIDGSAAEAGTAGAGPGSTAAGGTGGGQQEPVWGQHTQQQQPYQGQQPWGGAPAAGTPWGQQPAWGPGPGQTPPSSGLATGALITGILSLPLLLAFGLGAIAGIVAVVLGVIALRRAKRGEASGRGMAIGGIVTGAISIVLGVIVAIFLFSFGFAIVDEMEACMQETGGDSVECQRRLERELTDRFTGS